ncbi:MAG: hypothetical protein JWQ71_4579 [Pedosphaera sp.]|nr:hypothetical protein [Pedosphaera sp.]
MLQKFQVIVRVFMLGCCIFLIGNACADSLPSAQSAPEWDALFQHTNGWTGADANFSVPLSTNKTLWLFGDTWIGEVKDGKRTNTVMINNTIAIQDGQSRPEFFRGTQLDGRPTSFFKPQSGHGYFWPFHGIRTAKGLYVVLQQVENIPDRKPGPFNFHLTSLSLAHIPNPDDPPGQWKVSQQKVPFAMYSPKGDLVFGVSFMREGEFIYIYGFDSRPVNGEAQSSLVAARVPEEHLGELKAWRFFTDGKWEMNAKQVTRMSPGFPTEFSVSYQPALKKYVAIYMANGISGRIVQRTAQTPTGPWSEPVVLYECPEKSWPEKTFCYSAKAHPELSTSPDELLITYAANSWELRYVINDARLYWPRFVRVKYNAGKE